MTLLLSNGSMTAPDGSGVISSDESSIVRDLGIISLGDTEGDSSLEPFDSSILGPNLDQLVYDQTVSGVGPDLITFLVNAQTNVLIFGVDSATVGALGGPTGLGDTSQQPDGSILVIYDTTSCGGNGAFVFDVNKNKIPDPPFIILAHELAHAKDFVSGTINNSTPESVAEELATVVENQIRAEAQGFYQQLIGQSIDLSQRNPTDHGGGCNPASSQPPPGSDPWKINCFIASAAYQSIYAEKVEWLRRFRDKHLRDTKMGREFFDTFYRDYYEYSPGIARDMAASVNLRDAVRHIIVDPFIEFLVLFEFFLLDDERGAAFAARVDGVLRAQQSSRSVSEAETILSEIERMRSMFERNAWERVGDDTKCPEPASASSVIRYLAASILAKSDITYHSIWVLVEPLLIHWSAARERAGGANAAVFGASYLLAIEKWVDRLPLPPCFALMSRVEAAAELARLKHMMFRGMKARCRFGLRLVSEFDGSTSYDLRRLLREIEFAEDPE